MRPSDKPNPERRSDAALLCLCIGIGLLFLAQFLGAGVVIAAAMAGHEAALGGLGAFLGVIFSLVLGVILSLIGGVWLVIRVIADARADSKERYGREVER